jgi:PncC family amidohydrolase
VDRNENSNTNGGSSGEPGEPASSILEIMPNAADRVAKLLKAANLKVVFAESCTGGLVSGSLTKIPGISNHHCGGVVVYRNETKQAYLRIPAAILEDPGPVSRQVAELMAIRVLKKTPEAHFAAAVTGHLGPNAPPALDGLVFIAVARRGANRGKPKVKVKRLLCRKRDRRGVRQRKVVREVLEFLGEQLETVGDP